MKTFLSVMKESLMELRNLGRTMGQVCLILFLVGCATDPEFKTPASPAVSGYTASALPAQTASSSTALGGEQRFADLGFTSRTLVHNLESVDGC